MKEFKCLFEDCRTNVGCGEPLTTSFANTYSMTLTRNNRPSVTEIIGFYLIFERILDVHPFDRLD